jgi:heat shock protein HslJ
MSTDGVAAAFRRSFQVVVDQTELPTDQLPLQGLTSPPRRRFGWAVATVSAVVVLVLAAVGLIADDVQPVNPEPTVAGSPTTPSSTGATSTNPDDDLGIDRSLADVDISGTWIVTEFSINGEWHTVRFGRNAENEPEVGANAEFQPWIEIGEEMRGYPGGCNEFGGVYLIDGNALSLEGMMTLRGCQASDLEQAFSTFLPDKVMRVEVEGGTMTWSTSETSLRFERGTRDR